MEFDRFTLVHLRTPVGDPPDEATTASLMDGHLAHLAALHDEGRLIAAGPVLDPEHALRGFAILVGPPDETRALMERDPGVVGGMFALDVFECIAPSGCLVHTEAAFPRSLAEARGN